MHADSACARARQVAITVPGDNSVDLFTNDLGIVVISNEAGEVQGYNLLVGGGMGRTARCDALLHASLACRGIQETPSCVIAPFLRRILLLGWCEDRYCCV